MWWRFVPLVMLAMFLANNGARAEPCPQSLVSALRLIMVTPQGPDAAFAILETFERTAPDQPWRPIGGLRSAVVGKKGVAWGAGFRNLAKAGEPLKREGDLKSPMGIYAMGPTFGFDAANFPGHMKLELGRHICVEEPGSQSYGQIVDSARLERGIKYDEMAAEQLYRKGVVVDYPADGANKAGSCIFIHVWREPGKGTAGCVALDENDVGDLQAFASGAPTAIAILTADARARIAGCLP